MQSYLPELIKIQTSLSENLYKNDSLIISENISNTNMFFNIRIDLSTTVGKGSFGTIHPCVLSITKEDKVISQVDDLVIKIIRNDKCIENTDLYKEISIHCLVYNTVNYFTPKIYPYTLNIDTKTAKKCYNGLLQENISGGSIHLYKNRLCHPNVLRSPKSIVDEYFHMIGSIKETLLELYENYNFKHNDLHSGNVLFNGFDPKIIDYGESTINHQFSNKKIATKVNPESIEIFYGEYRNEYEFIHYNYPLSDIHLFLFSNYRIFTTKGIFALINITDEFVSRMEEIYSLTRLGLIGDIITFNGVVVKVRHEFPHIYKEARRIIKYLVPKISEGVKSVWDDLCGTWSIFQWRIMAYLYAIYLPDKVNFIYRPKLTSMFFPRVKKFVEDNKNFLKEKEPSNYGFARLQEVDERKVEPITVWSGMGKIPVINMGYDKVEPNKSQ